MYDVLFHWQMQLIPSMNEHEDALIHVSNICHVKPNLQFYNILILRRLRRSARKDALVGVEY
jgi:hypothetical protein